MIARQLIFLAPVAALQMEAFQTFSKERQREDQLALDFVKDNQDLCVDTVNKFVVHFEKLFSSQEIHDSITKIIGEHNALEPSQKNVAILKDFLAQNKGNCLVALWALFKDNTFKKILDSADKLGFGSDIIAENLEKRQGHYMWSDRKGRDFNKKLLKPSRVGGISHVPLPQLERFWPAEIVHAKDASSPHMECNVEKCPAMDYDRCGVPFVNGASGSLFNLLALTHGYIDLDQDEVLIFMSAQVLAGHHSFFEMIIVAKQFGYFQDFQSPLTIDGCAGKQVQQYIHLSLENIFTNKLLLGDFMGLQQKKDAMSKDPEIYFTSFKFGFGGTYFRAPLHQGVLAWNEQDELVLIQKGEKNTVYNFSQMSEHCTKEMKEASWMKKNKLKSVFRSRKVQDFRTVGYFDRMEEALKLLGLHTR